MIKKKFNEMCAFADKQIDPLPKVFQKLNLSYKKRIDKALGGDHLFSYNFYRLSEIVLYMACVPQGRSFTCLMMHLHSSPRLEDSSFRLDKYLELKGEKDWDVLYDLKSKSFYEGFPLFFNKIVKAFSQYKELGDILTGAVPWRNPVLEARPKVNLFQFRTFVNKALIPGPEAFLKTGLVYQKQQSSVKKSKITNYREHEWYYYHHHPQSNIILKTCYVPEIGYFHAFIKKDEYQSIFLSDYLEFKKGIRPDFYYNAKNKQDPYNIFEAFMKALTDAILNEGLDDVIHGKKWVYIPTSITKLHLYK